MLSPPKATGIEERVIPSVLGWGDSTHRSFHGPDARFVNSLVNWVSI
jgi:hypothetical protein